MADARTRPGYGTDTQPDVEMATAADTAPDEERVATSDTQDVDKKPPLTEAMTLGSLAARPLLQLAADQVAGVPPLLEKPMWRGLERPR